MLDSKTDTRIEKNQCSRTIRYSGRAILEVIACRLEDKA